MPHYRIVLLGLLLVLAPCLAIANTLEVEITGSPPYGHALWQAVAMKLSQLPTPVDGASYRLKRLIIPHEDENGARVIASTYLSTQIDAPGKSYAQWVVNINYVTTEVSNTSRLYVSNSPERVYDYRTLLEGSLPPDISVRALYHHQNNANASMAFSVEIINPTSSPVRVHIIDANAGPSYDECLVGHEAAINFARRQDSNTGYILTVPAYSVLTPVRTVMPSGSTISGIMRLQNLTPGATPIIRMQTRSSDARINDPITQYTPSAVFGDFQYNITNVDYQGTYSVDGNWLFAPLGEQPTPAARPGQDLEGGYGVWHTYALTAENNTSRTARVELAATAVGGATRLIYSFGDEWHSTDVLRPNQQLTLLRFTLSPGGRRVIRFSTMPQSGSNYPLQFILKSTDTPGELIVNDH